ncbi:MAG: lamin tail domain-containing protein [Chloroflexota bacterium]
MRKQKSGAMQINRATTWWSRRSLVSSLVAVPALVALTACSGSPPSVPTQPTVQAAATQAVAAASPAVATLQANASPAVATAQAASSPVAGTVTSVIGTAVTSVSPMASPSPSPAASLPLRIADASLGDATPWVSIENSGDAPIGLNGWQLQVGEAVAELPPGTTVPAGGALTLHPGVGLSGNGELYLGNAGDAVATAALPGTPVRLTDPAGHVQAESTVPRY